jgi:hypothetical protein
VLNDADVLNDVVDGGVLNDGILNGNDILTGDILTNVVGDVTTGDILTDVVGDVTVIDGDVIGGDVIGGDVAIGDLIDLGNIELGDVIDVVDTGGCGCGPDGTDGQAGSGGNGGGDTTVINNDIDNVIGDVITIVDIGDIVGGSIVDLGDTIIDNSTTTTTVSNVTNNVTNTVSNNVTNTTVVNTIVNRFVGTKVVHPVHRGATIQRVSHVTVQRLVRVVNVVHGSQANAVTTGHGPVVTALPQAGSGSAGTTAPAGLLALVSLVTALAGAGVRAGALSRLVA